MDSDYEEVVFEEDAVADTHDETDTDIIVPVNEADLRVHLVEKIIIVEPKNWCTSDILTKFEIAEIISIRASAIAQNLSGAFAETGGSDDPIKIAQMELVQRKVPLLVRRAVKEEWDGDTKITHIEVRNPNDMIHSIKFPV